MKCEDAVCSPLQIVGFALVRAQVRVSDIVDDEHDSLPVRCGQSFLERCLHEHMSRTVGYQLTVVQEPLDEWFWVGLHVALEHGRSVHGHADPLLGCGHFD